MTCLTPTSASTETNLSKSPCDVKHVGKLRLKDLEKYDIIISANPLYSSTDNEFLSVNLHIKGHNETIEKNGVCLVCQRMKSPHYIEKAIKQPRGVT